MEGPTTTIASEHDIDPPGSFFPHPERQALPGLHEPHDKENESLFIHMRAEVVYGLRMPCSAGTGLSSYLHDSLSIEQEQYCTHFLANSIVNKTHGI